MTSAEVVAELRALGEQVATLTDPGEVGWSAEDGSAVLLALVGLQERVSAAVLRTTAAWDRAECWRADGSLSAVPWLRARGMPERDARRMVRSGRLVARNDDLAKLLDAGDLTASHVDALATYVTPPRAALFDEHADVLLDAMRSLSVDDTALMARRWASYADDVLHRGEPEALHGRRGVWFGRTGDVEQMRCLGDPIDLAVLRALLDRLEPPDRNDTPGGPRTLAQRRYDALIALADAGPSADGRRDPAHTVDVVIDDTTLTGGFDPHGRADLPGHGSLLPTSVQRLLCGSWISRVIVDPEGVPLDLGRRARLFSSDQRRAVLVRDGGCAFENCDRPPEWCDVHHLDPYGPATDGPTDLANGLTACRPHHTLIHQGWTPYQDEHGRWHLRPP